MAAIFIFRAHFTDRKSLKRKFSERKNNEEYPNFQYTFEKINVESFLTHYHDEGGNRGK